MGRAKVKKSELKAENQRVHFHNRLQQRVPNAPESFYHDIRRAIQGKPSPIAVTFHSRQSSRISRWLVTLQGTLYMVVYDHQRKTLVTIFEANLSNSLDTTQENP